MNKRDDGYHNIVSLMASIGLHDLLKLEEIRETGTGESRTVIKTYGGTYSGICDSIPEGQNLISRAAMAYFDKTGISADAVFLLEKNIPAGAGMGGGSADAAAALKILNARFNRLNRNEMIEIGGKIGADVPFCITGGTAICRGIGDRITPLRTVLPFTVLIVNTGAHVDTGKAYRMLGRKVENPRNIEEIDADIDEIIRGLDKGDFRGISGILANDFEGPVFQEYPELNDIKNCMREKGSVYTAMTGSGSSIVGLFEDAETAEKSAVAFRGNGHLAVVTKFVRADDIR